MKKYKGIIILIIVLLVYSLIMFFLFSSKEEGKNPIEKITESINDNSDKRNNYFIVTDNSEYEYYYKSFRKTSVSNIEKQDKFNVYVDNKLFGEYKLKYVSLWNLFDENNNFKMYDGKLFAVSNNLNTKVRDIKIREMNESDKVLLINKFNLNTFNYITTDEVVDIDLDNNGVNDEIICLSSMQESDNSNNHYNIVVVKLNDDIITLVEEKGDNAKYVYNIYSVINIFDRQQDNIIISRTKDYDSDAPSTQELIYQYKNNQYVIE